MGREFGKALKEWRNCRRISQLDLGLRAGVSARHISFLETGRSRPSREMVQRLSEHLEIPLSSRNALLNAAGFAAVYSSRDLDDDEMAQIRAAIDWTLRRHEPFPAMALDRYWNVVRTNTPGSRMLSVIGLRQGGSMLDAITDTERMESAVVNWSEVAQHLLGRLRTESAFVGGDPVLDGAADRLAAAQPPRRAEGGGPLPAVVPIEFRVAGATLSLFSTIAQFGTAEDIALADLRLEMYFPANEQTREALISLMPN